MGFYLNDYLIANGVSLRKRVSELFDQLEQDRELAKVFIQNPTVVLQSKIFPEFPATDEESVSAANQLLFSVLTNEKFTKWTEKYQKSLMDRYNKTGKIPDKKELLQGLARGIIEHGDPKILTDLLELSQTSTTPTEAFGFRHVWYYVEYYAWAYIYIFFIFLYAFANADKISLFDEKQHMVMISPKELRSLAEQMVKYAKQMRERKEKTPEK
ncbi:MAG TPA: hypothetical protein VKF36_20260 [Syntrophorhabdales bacterium]|nr:hypothetical protein [Syntrophorhabdales bacterium]